MSLVFCEAKGCPKSATARVTVWFGRVSSRTWVCAEHERIAIESGWTKPAPSAPLVRAIPSQPAPAPAAASSPSAIPEDSMTLTLKTDPQPSECRIEGCSNAGTTRGLCKPHYGAAWRAGRIDELALPSTQRAAPAPVWAAPAGETPAPSLEATAPDIEAPAPAPLSPGAFAITEPEYAHMPAGERTDALREVAAMHLIGELTTVLGEGDHQKIRDMVYVHAETFRQLARVMELLGAPGRSPADIVEVATEVSAERRDLAELRAGLAQALFPNAVITQEVVLRAPTREIVETVTRQTAALVERTDRMAAAELDLSMAKEQLIGAGIPEEGTLTEMVRAACARLGELVVNAPAPATAPSGLTADELRMRVGLLEESERLAARAAELRDQALGGVA